MALSRKNVLLLAALILIILIGISIILVIFLNNNKFGSSDSSQNIQTSIIIDGKKQANPTFSDLGFSWLDGDTYKTVVKIKNVYKTDSEVSADLQMNQDAKSIQKVIFYKDKLNAPLYWTANDNHPYTSTETGDATVLNSATKTYDSLNNLKEANILLFIESNNTTSGIQNYQKCNIKWIDYLTHKNKTALNCTPMIWDFIKYVKN